MTDRDVDIAPSPLLVILDFDGTIVSTDVGDALCDRFAAPSWRDVDRLWEAGQISLDTAQNQMWSSFRASIDEILHFLSENVRLRDGFDELIAWSRHTRVPVIIASGGFDLYIHAMLAETLDVFEAVYCNSLALGPDETPMLQFPHKNSLGCDRCPVCKGKVCTLYRPRGRVVFMGDGTSDVCALGSADDLFVVANSKLHHEASRRGINAVPFHSFREVIPLLDVWLEEARVAGEP